VTARVFLERAMLGNWSGSKAGSMRVRFEADVQRIRIFAGKHELNVVKMGNQYFPLSHYLVDPQVFNADNPASKGVIPLREGERIQIGRDHSHGFQLGPTVALLQFSIMKSGDEFEIIDHNSTNGTQVMAAFKVSPQIFRVGMDISRIEGLDTGSRTRAIISRIDGDNVYVEFVYDYSKNPKALDQDYPDGYNTTLTDLMEKLRKLQDK